MLVKIFACRLAVLHTIMNLHCVHIILHSRFYFSSFHFFFCIVVYFLNFVLIFTLVLVVLTMFIVLSFIHKKKIYCTKFYMVYLQIIMNHDTEENGKTCTSPICCIICMQNSYFVSRVTNLLYTFLLLQYTLYLQQ